MTLLRRACIAVLVLISGGCAVPLAAMLPMTQPQPGETSDALAHDGVWDLAREGDGNRRFALPPVGVQEPETIQTAEEGHGELHRHHVALFVGGGYETKEGHKDETGSALGGEYEFRLHEHWGVGVVGELLGQDTVRNALLVFPVSFHPVGGLRLVAGPGVEFSPDEEKFAVRLGGGYIFQLTDRWTLAPELFVDLLETGERTVLGGIALGYGF